MSQLKMPNINQVALSGRLVQDPDFTLSETGMARLTARIAVNRTYRDRNDAWQEETSFFDIASWQKPQSRLPNDSTRALRFLPADASKAAPGGMPKRRPITRPTYRSATCKS